VLIKRFTPSENSDAESLLRFAKNLSAEVDPALKAICEPAGLPFQPAIDISEAIDDVFIQSESLRRVSTCNYSVNSRDFEEHRRIISNLDFYARSEVVPRNALPNLGMISLTVSSVLIPVTEAILSDAQQRKVLLPQIVEIIVWLFEHEVLPSEAYFVFKPLSQRVVIVPVLSSPLDCQNYLRNLLETYWNEIAQLKDTKVLKFSRLDYDIPSLLFGEVEVMKDVDVRDWNGMTLWALRIPCISLFHMLIWKHHLLYFPPPRYNYHSSSSDIHILEGQCFTFSTEEANNGIGVSSAYTGEGEQSERSTIEEHSSLVSLDKLSHAPRMAYSHVSYDLPILIEYKWLDLLAETKNVKPLLKLGEILDPMHQKGQFHGLITPATVRFDENARLCLSLAALDWVTLPLLYWAIPIRFRGFIAPEVREVAENLTKPNKNIDFTRADSYSVAMLIAEYGQEECRQMPKLDEIVRLGQAENWSERPTLQAILAVLRIALSFS
jgi:hypothetical protein